MTRITDQSTRRRRIGAAAGSALMALAVGMLTLHQMVGDRSAIAVSAPNVLQQIEVRTKDYAFEMPAKLRAGLTHVTLVNDGKEPHHLWILKLEGGKRLADVYGALKSGIEFPSWAKNIGGPNSPVPGGKSIAIVNLEPGHYAVLCVIPAPDGTPHVMKGMAKEFDVTGEAPNDAELSVDIEATLSDYDFTFATPLSPGRKTIRFTNKANQVHEAFIAKLTPGAKAVDLLAWEKKPEGPIPVIPMGGITGIEPGRSIAIVLDLEPGTYAFYCFVADAKDGKPHLAHGMMKEFTVAAR